MTHVTGHQGGSMTIEQERDRVRPLKGGGPDYGRH
jgi:hypothetical protein